MPRFSLKQLLVFVFACCIYLAALRNLIMSPRGILFALDGLDVVTQIGAWLTLIAVYWSWRLGIAMFVHTLIAGCWAVITFGIALVFSGEPVGIEDGVAFAVLVAAYGTLASFPLAIIAIVARGLELERHTD